MTSKDQAVALMRLLTSDTQIDAAFDETNTHPLDDNNLPDAWRARFAECNGETGPLRRDDSKRLVSALRQEGDRNDCHHSNSHTRNAP